MSVYGRTTLRPTAYYIAGSRGGVNVRGVYFLQNIKFRRVLLSHSVLNEISKSRLN